MNAKISWPVWASACLLLAAVEARERHHFGGLRFREGRPAVSWIREGDGGEEDSELEVFFANSLTGRWQRVQTLATSAAVTNGEYTLGSEYAAGDSGFFAMHAVVDSDGDGLSDAREELELGTDPQSADTDMDSIPDGYEVANGMNPRYHDSDDDGMPDDFELMYHSDPLKADTDGDGLSDCDEWLIYYTDLNSADTDQDMVDDAEEVAFGSDPLRDYSLDPSFRDYQMVQLGVASPYGEVAGSTNLVWEHIFYSGTPDGAISYPMADDTHAVLKLKVRGTGYAEIQIGDSYHTLYYDEARRTRSVRTATANGLKRTLSANAAEEAETLLVSVVRGVRQEIVIYSAGLDIGVDADEYMIGERPTWDYGIIDGIVIRLSGWIIFPNTQSSCPCIHTYSEQSLTLSLDPGPDVHNLVCHWTATSAVEITRIDDLSVSVKGNFRRGILEGMTYTLKHPQALSGANSFQQRAEYCMLSLENKQTDDESADDGDASHEDWNDREEGEDHHTTHDTDRQYDTYEDMADLMPHPDVLLLRNDPVVKSLALDVDENCPACCRCPEHFAGAVKLASKSHRLQVLTSDGENFSYTGVDRTVYVTGLRPSEFLCGDLLSFTRGGKTYESHAYTILGLAINSRTLDLIAWNQRFPQQGLPVGVCPSDPNLRIGDVEMMYLTSGAELELVYNVKLDYGRIRLALNADRGKFRFWVSKEGDEMWKLLLDSDTRPVVSLSTSEWAQYVQNCRVKALVSAESVGEAELEFSYGVASGGMRIGDKVTQRFTAGAPRLVLDYDRNGKIDLADEQLAASGRRTFRFWVNDDRDETEGVGGLDDLPGIDGNAEDSSVNGPRDLVDLVPLYVDLRNAFPTNMDSAIRQAIRWRINSSCLNVLESHLRRDAAGDFQHRDCGKAFGVKGQQDLYSATMHSASPGYELSEDFVNIAKSDPERGILLMEGYSLGTDLAIEGWTTLRGEEVCLMKSTARINVSPVDEMYRWLSLRNSEWVDDSGEPPNRDGDESPEGDRRLVFVHGFNVNESEARAWAAEMYKRLWQAGFDGEFVAVDWAGDSSQFHSVLKDDNYAPDYYVNVKNAFLAAARLPEALAPVRGQFDLIGHSLGNMVISAAIADYGLPYNRYYMLNAAVPMEAYDDTAYASEMVDTEWRKVPDSYWASNWSGLFGSWDFRSTLSWQGRFAGIRNVVNCYSETEDVLANPKSGQLTFTGGAWKIQELAKGTTTWYDLNAISLGQLDVVCEGGWGINPSYGVNPLWYIYQYGFTSLAEKRTSREVAITDPLFTPFKAMRIEMASLDDIFLNQDMDDHEVMRARFLGDAIPATSFAQGANPAGNRASMLNWSLPSLADNVETWPRGESEGSLEWRHSDVKDVSYFYVHRLFEKIVKGE